MRFNKAKCEVLHLYQGDSYYQYKLEDERIEHRPIEKNMGILVNGKMDMSQHCALTDQKANCVLCCIKRSIVSMRTDFLAGSVMIGLDRNDFKLKQERF